MSGKSFSGKIVGLALACLGWAGFIAALVLGQFGEPVGAPLASVSQWVIVTGLAIAVIGATESGFGALDRFFGEILSRSRGAPASSPPLARATIAPAPAAFAQPAPAPSLAAPSPAPEPAPRPTEPAPAAAAAPGPQDFAARYLDAAGEDWDEQAPPARADRPTQAMTPSPVRPAAARPAPARPAAARPTPVRPAQTRPAPPPAEAPRLARPVAAPTLTLGPRRAVAPTLPQLAPTHAPPPAETPSPLDFFPAPPPPANYDRAPIVAPFALDALQPFMDEAPAAAPAAPIVSVAPVAPAARPAGPVAEGEVGGRPYRLFADGAVEIDTLLGARRFPSMEAACRFVGVRAA